VVIMIHPAVDNRPWLETETKFEHTALGYRLKGPKWARRGSLDISGLLKVTGAEHVLQGA
jgi:hypothetical protein